VIAHVIDGEAKGGDFSRKFCTEPKAVVMEL
jgi:hypothetical protein